MCRWSGVLTVKAVFLKKLNSRAAKRLALLLLLVSFAGILFTFDREVAFAAVCDCSSCHTSNHHGDTWSACSTCHLAPPQTGSHGIHAATLSNSTYGDTVTSTAGEYKFGCGHCHDMSVTTVSAHTAARSARVQLYNPAATGIGQTGTQVCTDCHGVGPHGDCDGTSECASCHRTMAQSNHPVQAGTPSTCGQCHVTRHAGNPLPTHSICDQCHQTQGMAQHQFSDGQLSVYATDFHAYLPQTADFTGTTSATISRQVDFVATGCSGGSCSYIWDFGDLTTATVSTASTSHRYPSGGSYIAVVRITEGTSEKRSPVKTVTAQVINTPPVASKLTAVITGMSAYITDTSSDAQDAPGTMTVTLTCGNGTNVTGLEDTTLVCTYSSNGSYTLRHSVTDSEGSTVYSTNTAVTVPSSNQVQTLTVLKSGTGTGTVTGPGINCGSDCSQLFNRYSSVTLTASASAGSTFAGWSGGGCSGTGNCAVVLSADTTVTATFTGGTPAPVSDFTGTPVSGNAPLTVNFTDTSTNTPTSWSWTFGDGGTSTVQNPSYQYLTPGTYTVSLTATNAGGSSLNTKTGYITVNTNNVRIAGGTPSYYSSLQSAYDSAADGSTIESKAVTLTENLNFNRAVSVTLKGGYDDTFSTSSSQTVINGTITITGGTVTVDKIQIR